MTQLILDSFRIAFDDLIDGMEDEAMERDARTKCELTATRLTEHQASRVDVHSSLVPSEVYGGTSTLWQQRLSDVESKLQGDLQQDLAR